MNALYKQILQPMFVKPKLYNQPFRCHTNFIVQRKITAPLRKSNKFPSLRRRHRIYELVQPNYSPPTPRMDVLLTKYVENVGQVGEVANVRQKEARFLILTGQANYPTPENISVYHSTGAPPELDYSSRYVKSTMESLSKLVFYITMSMHTPWTIEPWHIRVSLRKANVHVPESAITLPKTPITGPNLALQGKEFYVTLTLNKREKCTLRCRLHHWSTGEDKIPHVKFHWTLPAELMFPEDKEIAKSLPGLLPPPVLDEDRPSTTSSKGPIRKSLK